MQHNFIIIYINLINHLCVNETLGYNKLFMLFGTKRCVWKIENI